MKASQIFKGSLLALALLLSTGAFAANKGSLQVFDTVAVAGKQLKPGTYKLQWDGNGSEVELSILQGKNVVATVPARVVTLPNTSEHDEAVLNRNPDGSTTLSEVRFSGKTYALDVTSDAASSGASSGSK
jgi:hypothetical protein